MVWLEARRVQVGSDPSDTPRGEKEVARRTVEFGKGFWLDQYEVTNDKFREFVLAVPEWQKGPGDPKLRNADYLNRWNGPTNFAAGIGRQP
jgi:formylglycine-generating enzyme required for sulfatase activity